MLPSAAAHVFVEDLADPRLEGADEHHLARVLRLRPGELVTVSDGRGSYRMAAWRGTGIEPTGPVIAVPPPEPAITIAFALTKGTKPEWAVQRLTEAGVDRIQPLVAAHSVAHRDRARTGERLLRVAREAAMQARRVRLPEIGAIVPFAGFVSQPACAAGGALAQMGGGPPSLGRPILLVGPEGGWAPDELACGLPAVGLGPAVLRAETAALAAGILLAALRDRLVTAAHS